jgi:predicted CoA-substrate-specific enzyme activase
MAASLLERPASDRYDTRFDTNGGEQPPIRAAQEMHRMADPTTLTTTPHTQSTSARPGPLFAGLDVGSVSAKLVVLDADNGFVEEHYVRTHGQPIVTARDLLADLFDRVPRDRLAGFAATGNGGKLLARILGIGAVNEIVAQSTGASTYRPDVRTIIEMGGEDSKLIKLDVEAGSAPTRIDDFAMNTVCAAGTGSFLDQQASRLGLNIEGEFGELALRSEHPPRVAGRCSVFAKSDMIHLQQEATPDYDIVAGLCHALARNFYSNICRGKEFSKPIAFQGGVAANAGMVRAFENVLELEPGELIIPEHFATLGAAGAVIAARRDGALAEMPDVDVLDAHLAKHEIDARRTDPLTDDGYFLEIEPAPLGDDLPLDVYLGVDVGSISTNLVLIDAAGRVVAREYLMTAGRPINAVQEGLQRIGRAFADTVVVRGAATTGSGRGLTGDFIGADVVKNEITTHATAAAFVHPDVDTIFEIGGQDSKYVSLDRGAVVDFTMNKVCAAGTGSFLEEQAERLGVAINEEFGERAMAATAPCELGDRCTVFVESALNHHQQQGVEKNDLIAGLCYSIVHNYLNKVVETRRVGDVILFQGGTAYNRGVRAAFEKVLGKRIIVPPHHDVMGAIGAALIAKEVMDELGRPSAFKGFDLSDRHYTIDTFECRECPNHCEIRRVSVEGERPLFYGSRCGKFDEEKREAATTRFPNVYAERETWLADAYPADKPREPNGRTIGIPQISHYFELFPLWKAFFTELGFRVVVSQDTNKDVAREGCSNVSAETCFPIKVAHGHVMDLMRKGVDAIFLPVVVDLEVGEEGFVNYYACPYVQTVPYFIQSALDLSGYDGEILRPPIHLSRGRKQVRRVLRDLAKQLGCSGRAGELAANAGFGAVDAFQKTLRARGREVLDELGPDDIAIVIVSRPYNGCDRGLNLDLPEKLRTMGATALPIDCLPLEDQAVADDFPHMYWKYGQRILAAARCIRTHPNLHAIYVTNFGCGPDSFISKFFEREMHGKPFLTIEIDEHSADAGMITRCEAFLDSLRNVSHRAAEAARWKPEDHAYAPRAEKDRTLYVPYMTDHGRAFAALMRRYGVDAVALPMADDETLEIGRRFTTGRECYPCIITTGDIVKQTMKPDFDPDRSAFLMPSACGPCRFGQYHKFHRMVLDDIGLDQVPIFELDQERGYNDALAKLGPSFRWHAWQGLVLCDLLTKLLLHTRPREKTPGETDEVYEHCLGLIERTMESGGDLRLVSQHIRESFDAIDVDRSTPRPLIGIVGEIYVRTNEFANRFIVRRLEALGAEVLLPPMEEWIDYIDHMRRYDFRVDRNWMGLAMEHVKERVKERDVRRLSKAFEGALPHFWLEESTAAVLKRASKYLDPAVRGESVLSMGRLAGYAQHGVAGVVNVTPFNCIPGTIVSGLMRGYVADTDHIPHLKMQYDGTANAGEELRIEAFMHQCRQAAAGRRERAQDTERVAAD